VQSLTQHVALTGDNRAMRVSPLGPTLPIRAPATLRHTGHIESGVKEASDLCLMADVLFLVVTDTETTLSIVSLLGKVEDVSLDHLDTPSELEAVTYDAIDNRLFVVREEASVLERYSFSGKGVATFEKSFPLSLGGPKNKGIEGACFLPGVGLLLAKEGKPKQLLLLAESGKGAPVVLTVDPRILAACGDFSGLAFDPVSRHLFICSQESACLVEATIDGNGATFLMQSDLVDAKGKSLKRVEGIAVGMDGTVFALTENDGKIHTFRRA